MPPMPDLRSFRRGLGWLGGLIFLSACATTSIGVVGESPVPPPTNVPLVSVSVLDDLGAPVLGATITVGDQIVDADDAGLGWVEWRGESVNASVEAPGFFPGAVALSEFREDPFSLALRPVVLRGTITDPNGFGLPGATVTLGESTAFTDDDGTFEIPRAVPGTLSATRPGWEDGNAAWSGSGLVANLALDPRVIRGLHVSGVGMANEIWDEMIQVAADTEVNALVIDLKDESGRVYYDSQVPLAEEVGAVDPTYDLEAVVAEMNAEDLYIIGRIVTFQDPLAARTRPEIAVLDTSTGGPYEKNGQYFLDPTDAAARQYALDIATEACAGGVTEIQFDYVRYPDGFSANTYFEGGSGADVRATFITSFLEEAGDILHPMGCAVAADIFGFITSVSDDGGIGQQFEALSAVTDVLSPMIYPSHYSTGWFGFDVPNNNPGPVVSEALGDAIPRVNGSAVIRPWLQDFYYDVNQVRAQIAAAEQRATGWMLWNAVSNFQIGALAPEGSDTTLPNESDDQSTDPPADGAEGEESTTSTAPDDEAADGESGDPGDDSADG